MKHIQNENNVKEWVYPIPYNKRTPRVSFLFGCANLFLVAENISRYGETNKKMITGISEIQSRILLINRHFE